MLINFWFKQMIAFWKMHVHHLLLYLLHGLWFYIEKLSIQGMEDSLADNNLGSKR